MPVQTTYSSTHDKAYAGMVADLQALNTVSKLNKTGAIIGYGKGVVTDGEDAAKLGGTGLNAATFIGVVMRELNRAYADGETFGARDKQDMTVVTHGVIWVKAATTVAKDDKVFVRVGSTNTGDFSNAAGTAATESVEIPGAKFLTAGDTGDLVKISMGIGG